MKLSPIECLAGLIDELMVGRELSKQSRMWLLIGLLRYAANPDSSIDDCLGLVAPGRGHLNGTLAMIQRNRHLAKAVRAISLDNDLETWPRCQRLANQIPELLKVWKAGYRHIEQPSIAWPEWKRHLFLAWRTGRTIPASARGIWDALKKSGNCSQSDPVSLLATHIPTGPKQ